MHLGPTASATLPSQNIESCGVGAALEPRGGGLSTWQQNETIRIEALIADAICERRVDQVHGWDDHSKLGCATGKEEGCILEELCPSDMGQRGRGWVWFIVISGEGEGGTVVGEGQGE